MKIRIGRQLEGGFRSCFYPANTWLLGEHDLLIRRGRSRNNNSSRLEGVSVRSHAYRIVFAIIFVNEREVVNWQRFWLI